MRWVIPLGILSHSRIVLMLPLESRLKIRLVEEDTQEENLITYGQI